jgi:hypothetical protein
MTTLDEPVAKQISKLFRLLAPDLDGEVLNAARRMRQLLAAEQLSFNDIATVIDNCNGEVEERNYSDADAKITFDRGVEKGRQEEAQKREAPPEFYDADGRPRWKASGDEASGSANLSTNIETLANKHGLRGERTPPALSKS